MNSIKYIPILFLLLLFGCAEQDLKPFSPEYKITVVGSDVYKIYKSSVASSWSEQTAINGASEQSRNYCNNKGKQTVLRSTSGGHTSVMTYTANEFFSCIDFSDNSDAARMARSQHNAIIDGIRFNAQLTAKRIAAENEKNLREREVRALENLSNPIRYTEHTTCNVGAFGTINCTTY